MSVQKSAVIAGLAVAASLAVLGIGIVTARSRHVTARTIEFRASR